MSTKAVFCIATSRDQADQIVEHLKNESFSKNDISALFPAQGAMRDSTHDNNTVVPEAVVADAGLGGVLGGALRWLATSGAPAFPGVGHSIAAGPLVAALSDVAEGGVANGLIRLGLPATEAKSYESNVKNGGILLAVHTDDVGDIARVKDIFKQAGVQNLYTASLAATKSEDLARFEGEGGRGAPEAVPALKH